MSHNSLLLRCGALIPSLFAYCLFLNVSPVKAQIVDSIPNSSEEQRALTLQPNPTLEVAQSSSDIQIRKIEVTGSTVLNAKDIEVLTKPVEGRSVSLEELKKVAQEITQLYVDKGYITSRAILSEQEIVDGVVKIRVLEGSIEKIEVQGTQRLNPNYVRDRVALGSGTPLNANKLEDQLRLLRNDPLFALVEASIKPGSGAGKSIVTVRVQEAPAFNVSASVDNYSPQSVGSERLGTTINYRNVTGLGDQLSASYFRTTNGGANMFDFSYKVPVNAKNGTVQLRVAPGNSEITDPKFSAFGIRSNSELYEINYRQPLVRSDREEFALSLGFSAQNGQTFLFQDTPFPFGIGPDADGNSRTRVLKFGQDYVKRDNQGAWALRSQLNFGLGIFDATTNSGSIPDGRFFSWQGQAQRVQQLSKDNLLIAQADVQLTPDSLLPSQQFVIGGGQSVRGFRQNARSGDNGVRFSLEDRIALLRDESGQTSFQLAPFVDLGAVWNNPDNPNKLPKQNFLAGAGLGLIWQPLPRVQVRADYAFPLVSISDKGNNAQDQGFYFSVVYNP